MVFDSSIVNQLAAVKMELEREKEEVKRQEGLREEVEKRLAKAGQLLENFISATGNNCRDSLEKTSGSARGFLDTLKAGVR